MNRLARLYNSETVRIVTIPAIMCRYINSKLLGTINPRRRTVNTCTNNPKRASKNAFKIIGRMLKGTT